MVNFRPLLFYQIMKLEFFQNLKIDVQNWQDTFTAKSYGVNWRSCMPKDMSSHCIQDIECLTNYLQNTYYNSGKITSFVKILKNKINTLEIKNDLEFLMGVRFPDLTIRVFITTLRRAPYSVQNNFFYLSYHQKQNDWEKALSSIYHELMHFLFHWHYWDKCRSYGLDDKQIHILKESLTILLNPILEKKKLSLDKGYQDHQLLRKKILKLWQEKQDFNFVLKKIIQGYFLNN